MSSGNGNGNGQAVSEALAGHHVADALAQPYPRWRKTADLSSAERSALNDEMVRTVAALVKQVDALTKSRTELTERIAFLENFVKKADARICGDLLMQRAMLDAHAGVIRRKFLARLRWLVTGC